MNRYTYCANNLLRYIDQSGHFWSAIIIVLVNVVKDAAIGAGIELALQIIEKPDDIDTEEVVFEAVFSGATTFLGGVYSVARKAEKTINTVRKVQKDAKATKIANATFKGVLKAGAKEVPEGLVENLAYQLFVEDKALDGLDLGQALEAAAISGIMGANDKLMDNLLPKKRHGAKDGKKASQTTGLIADAADDEPHPKADALPDSKGKGAAKGQKVNGTVKSGSTGGASKNQGKMQGQTVDSSVRGDKVAPKP